MPNTMRRARTARLVAPLVAAGYVASAALAASAQDELSLDLLFVIDNSASMAQEQAALSAQFPKLIESLTAGHNGPGAPLRPFHDVHLGVVSSDMGVVGIANAFPGCNTQRHIYGGDDGLLQHASSLAPGCSASYPAFLSFEPNYGDPLQLAQDLSCIAALGTMGCGFEQPLESALKAVWPKTYIDEDGTAYPPDDNPIKFLSSTYEGRFGHGDTPVAEGGNGGFSRSDRDAGSSLIAIIVVTDEDDCSSRSTEHLGSTNDPNDPLSTQPPNLRCYYNKQNLFQLERYVRGFPLLRPGEPNKVVFAAIAGVPVPLIERVARADIDLANPAEREQYYDDVLADARMQETVDSAPTAPQANLVPSCDRMDAAGQRALAFPPRRLVEVVKGLGERGHLDSVCRNDFGPVADRLVSFLSAARDSAAQ